MRLIKLAIISVIVLFLVITAFSLFIPSRVRISRALKIGASPYEILDQVSDIRKWKGWYPGFDTIQFVALDSGGGRLTSVNAGGKSIIISETKNTEVVAQFGEGKGLPVNSGWRTLTFEGSDSTTVQWYMDFKLRWYPWEKFSSLTFEKLYGPRMEQGLSRLKTVAEN
jgi:hypothetical protein